MKRAEQKIGSDTSQKPKEWFDFWLLGAALSFYLLLHEYGIRLNTWFLSGPDTLYLDYGPFSLTIACIVALLDTVILGSTLDAFFADLWERFQGKKTFRGFWKETAWGLFFLAAVLAVLHSLILVSCLSRTEVTTTGASTYFLGIRTSYHSFEELTETEVYTTKSAGLGRGGFGHSVDNLNYILRFQDGYELHLVHSYLDQNFVHGWNGKAELDNIVLPLAPQKTTLDKYKSR